MNPKELENCAEFMFSKNQTSKLSGIIKIILKGCGYDKFTDVMEKYGYKICFLKKLSPKMVLVVTNHARDRTSSYLFKEDMTNEEMKTLLLKGRAIPYGDLLAMGFRPNYKDRLENGEESIYVDMSHGLIAVLQPENETELIWVTTYSEKRLMNAWRVPITEEEFRKLNKNRKTNKIRRKRT